MKITNLMLAGLVSACIFTATSCGQKNPGTTQDNTSQHDNNENNEEDSSSKYDLKEISELLKIGEELENDKVTEEKYYCKGVIEKITDPSKNAIIFKDDSGSIFCYRVNGKTTIEPSLKVGEELILQGSLKKYKNKIQLNYPDIIERKVKTDPPLTEAECTEMTVDAARKSNPDTKVKVTGVVSIITKTQQNKDNGFYLVDETGSIYVHSEKLVSSVKKGNKITILAKRDNYKGSSETNANKQGYLGSIQLVAPVLLTNDNKEDNKFDTSWIKETTIKEIIDTPLSTNITSTIYKVKAFVKKSEVNNNTIIILNDIDNKTGAIVYSCNKASDFSWLMKYDGKLVELYLAPHNVNVTESSYNYRLQPIEVIKQLDNYSLDDAKKAEYIATYHVSKQFVKTYTSDPSIKLMTTFSEELWGIENATISYTSDNLNVIKIENNELHCLNKGNANIEATVKVNEAIFKKTFKITFNKIDISEALTVKEAIDTKVNTEILVKGIVSSKIANKDAIYITDNTGTLAVSLKTKDYLADLHIGDEVVFKGTRDFRQKDTSYTGGQSHLLDAELLVNLYGKNEISTAAYLNSTIETLRGFDENIDHTTTVYTVKATIERENGSFSTNTTLKDGANSLFLYSGSDSDYEWVAQFVNKGEVEAHVMLCDWNQKGLKGALLSVTYNNVTTYNDAHLAK